MIIFHFLMRFLLQVSVKECVATDAGTSWTSFLEGGSPGSLSVLDKMRHDK